MNFGFVGVGSLIIFNNRLSSSISARQEKYISADFFSLWYNKKRTRRRIKQNKLQNIHLLD